MRSVLLHLLAQFSLVFGTVHVAATENGHQQSIDLARQALQEGRLNEARQVLNAWLQEHPNDASAVALLGRTELTHANEIRETGPAAQVASSYLEARRLFEQADQLGEDSPSTQRAIGFCYYRAEEYETAIEYFSRALSGATSDAGILLLRALCQRRLRNHELALKDLERATNIKPGHVRVALAYSELLDFLGRRLDAKRVLLACRDRLPAQPAPPHVLLLDRLYRISNSLNQIDEVTSYLKTIRSLVPDYHVRRVQLGISLYRQGNFAEAAAEFEPIFSGKAKVAPHLHGLAYFFSGLMAQQSGDDAAACQLFDKSLELSPNSSAVLKNLAGSLRRLGDKERARNVLEQFRKVVEIDQANHELRKTLRKDPYHHVAHVELIRNCIQLARVSEARTELKRFRGLAPTHPAIRSLERALKNLESRREN